MLRDKYKMFYFIYDRCYGSFENEDQMNECMVQEIVHMSDNVSTFYSCTYNNTRYPTNKNICEDAIP